VSAQKSDLIPLEFLQELVTVPGELFENKEGIERVVQSEALSDSSALLLDDRVNFVEGHRLVLERFGIVEVKVVFVFVFHDVYVVVVVVVFVFFFAFVFVFFVLVTVVVVVFV
jgi:hypothetical protein